MTRPAGPRSPSKGSPSEPLAELPASDSGPCASPEPSLAPDSRRWPREVVTGTLATTVLVRLPVPVLVLERRGRIVFANHAVEKLFGVTLTEIPTVGALLSRVSPNRQERRKLSERLAQDLRGRRDSMVPGVPVGRLALPPLKLKTADGTIRYLEVQTEVFEQDVLWLVTFTDVDRAIKNEESLRDREQRLAVTLDSIADAVITTNARGKITRVNPVAGRLTGYDPELAVGLPLSRVFRVGLSARNATNLRIATLAAGAGPLEKPYVLSSHDGTERLVAFSTSTIRGAGGRPQGTVLVFRDITDQRELEQRMRQTEKLEALSQLIGGVAHEFNNRLAGVLSHAELLKLRLPPSDTESQRSVSQIAASARQAAELIAKLLAFSHEPQRDDGPFDVHELLTDVARELTPKLGARIGLELSLSAPGSHVRGDAKRLRDAVVQLANNARDAMGRTGTLSLRTSLRTLDHEQGQRLSPVLAAGTYLQLAVCDNGKGMEPQLMSRIFEPFFTTKTGQPAAGLGLAAVYGIIQGHGGSLEAQSRPGNGTTVNVLLPTVAAPPLGPVSEQLVLGTGRVLLVDDEPPLRRVGAALLKRLGYDVLTASDGLEALERYRTAAGSIDLVLLDVIMPKLGGKETLAQLLQLDPAARVLFVTGYGLGGDDATQPEGALGVVRKPFTALELSRRVSRAIRTHES